MTHSQSHKGPRWDLPGQGQPVFVCMLSARHPHFMATNAENACGFFLSASLFSFLHSIFCSSKPECPKKRSLPTCSQCAAPLEGCSLLDLLNRIAEPQEGTTTFTKNLPEAQKSLGSPEKRPHTGFAIEKSEAGFPNHSDCLGDV